MLVFSVSPCPVTVTMFVVPLNVAVHTEDTQSSVYVVPSYEAYPFTPLHI